MNNEPDYNDNLYFEEKKMHKPEVALEMAKRLHEIGEELDLEMIND